MECTCPVCLSACRKRPGWFLPDEVEPAARLLGLPLQDFFNGYLVVDYYVGKDTQFIFLLAPRMGEALPGREAPFDPYGACAFFDPDDRCTIHASKPRECAHFDHTISYDSQQRCRLEVVAAWNNPPAQGMIRTLLGREALATMPSEREMARLLLQQLRDRFLGT